MPSTAVLELPAAAPAHVQDHVHAHVRVQRHRPRREQTATSVLRAIGTGPIPQIIAPPSTTATGAAMTGAAERSSAGAATGARRTTRTGTGTGATTAPGTGTGTGTGTSADDVAPTTAAAVRSLRMRDIAAGGAAATGSWTLASHLGLLGTATGTFIASVASTILVAIAADSLAGTRIVLLRTLRRWRQAHRHHTRR